MTKIFLLLWVIGGSSGEIEMPSLEVCHAAAASKLQEAIAQDAGEKTVDYVAACIVRKIGGKPA